MQTIPTPIKPKPRSVHELIAQLNQARIEVAEEKAKLKENKKTVI